MPGQGCDGLNNAIDWFYFGKYYEVSLRMSRACT